MHEDQADKDFQDIDELIHKNPRKNHQLKSPVWNHFQKTGEEGICNYCNAIIKCKGSTTTGLARHLAFIHGIQVKLKSDGQEPLAVKRMVQVVKRIKVVHPSVVQTQNNLAMAKILAKLAAVDGLSVKSIANSTFIRESMSKQGMMMPRTGSDVLKVIMEFYEETQRNLVSMFLMKKLENHKLSISLDEMVNERKRRFIIIHIRYLAENDVNKKICLGALRIKKRRLPEYVVELVKQKLREYNLSLEEDILTSTTDDQPIMMEYNLLSPTIQHLCYNQAIKQSVLDVLYDSIKTQTINSASSENSGDEEDEFSDQSNFFRLEFDGASSVPCLTPEIDGLVNKVRAVVKYFNQAPERNVLLQTFVMEEHGEERNLLINNRAKWNTLEIMISRFLQIKSSISKALQKLNRCDLWNDNDMMALTDLHRTLELLRISVEALNRPNINLLASEGVLKFLFNSLNRNTKINQALHSSLKSKLRKRRSSEIVSLFKYLQNPQIVHECAENEYYEMSPKASLVNLANQILSRLGYHNLAEIGTPPTSSSLPGSGESTVTPPQQSYYLPSTSTSLQDELEKSISQCYTNKTSVASATVTDNYEFLHREFNLFEMTGVLTPTLQKVYDVLKTSAPTSTDIDKIFAIGNYYDQEICEHTHLETINAMCVMKSYLTSE